jgi:hypothetical protein
MISFWISVAPQMSQAVQEHIGEYRHGSRAVAGFGRGLSVLS